MVITTSPKENLVTDTWVKGSWEEFLALADNPDYEKAKFYYYRECLRIETADVGSLHGRQHSIVSGIITYYATLKNFRFIELRNSSFRHPNLVEFQPDLSYYLGADFELPPPTDSPINISEFKLPALVVEIGVFSLGDDLGKKRLMYEQFGVKEYWAVDANNDDVIAFSIADRGSKQVEQSLVLEGLELAVVEEALKRSHNCDDTAVYRWFIEKISQV